MNSKFRDLLISQFLDLIYFGVIDQIFVVSFMCSVINDRIANNWNLNLKIGSGNFCVTFVTTPIIYDYYLFYL